MDDNGILKEVDRDSNIENSEEIVYPRILIFISSVKNLIKRIKGMM